MSCIRFGSARSCSATRRTEDTVVAGILHDVLEDTLVAEAELRRRLRSQGHRDREGRHGAGQVTSAGRADGGDESIACGPRPILPCGWSRQPTSSTTSARSGTRSPSAVRRRPGDSSTRRGPTRRATTARWRKHWLRTIRSRRLFQQLALEVAQLFAPEATPIGRSSTRRSCACRSRQRPYLAEPRRQWRPARLRIRARTRLDRGCTGRPAACGGGPGRHAVRDQTDRARVLRTRGRARHARQSAARPT